MPIPLSLLQKAHAPPLASGRLPLARLVTAGLIPVVSSSIPSGGTLPYRAAELWVGVAPRAASGADGHQRSHALYADSSAWRTPPATAAAAGSFAPVTAVAAAAVCRTRSCTAVRLAAPAVEGNGGCGDLSPYPSVHASEGGLGHCAGAGAPAPAALVPPPTAGCILLSRWLTPGATRQPGTREGRRCGWCGGSGPCSHGPRHGRLHSPCHTHQAPAVGEGGVGVGGLSVSQSWACRGSGGLRRQGWGKEG